jgi:APA family basic amino acid/polyamine antiporter
VDNNIAAGENHAGRRLGALSLTLVGIGTVIVAGIFVITGQAAAAYAGPAIIYSFLIAGVVCVFAGLCYAEMGAMMPVAGSAYSFSRAAFGRWTGWVVGWALVAEYLFAMAAIAIGWSAYMQGVVGDFGIHFPAAWATSPLQMQGQSLVPTGAVINLPAVLLVLLVTLSHLRGVKESVRLNVAIVWLKLSAVGLFIGFGLLHADAQHWVPFVPPLETRRDGSTAYSLAGVLQAAGVVFFAYLGFDALGTAAQETRNPQRNLPIAILGTLVVATLLYIGVSLAMTGLADFRTLGTDAPITTALAAVPELGWLKTYVGVAVTIGLWSAIWPCLFALSRLFMCFAEDGLMPARLAEIDPVRRTARPSLVLAGGLGMVVAGFLPISLLGELISTGTLIAFATVCAAVIRLRLVAPDRVRPFRVPVFWLTASLGIASCLFLLASMGWFALARIAAWQIAGLVVLAAALVATRRRAHA